MPLDFEQLGDRELDALWRAGTREAGHALVSRHFDRLVRFFAIACPAHADDLTQDTFVAYLHSRDGAPDDVRGYLMGIARHKVQMYWRSHARRRDRPVDFELDSVEDLEETPTQVRARTEDQRLLLRALRGVPIETQILLQLYYWEGMTGPELARFFGATDQAIRHRLLRARELLARRLSAAAADPDARRTTCDNLDRWVQRVRARADERPRGA